MITNFLILENGNSFYDLPALTFNHRNTEILTRVGWFKYLVSDDTGAQQCSFTCALLRI